jgi:hypothetical protein
MTWRQLLRREVSLREFVDDLTVADWVAIGLFAFGCVLLSALDLQIMAWVESRAFGRNVDPIDLWHWTRPLTGIVAILVADLLWASQRKDVWRRRR